MSFVKPIAKAGGFGLAGMAASKGKVSPLALASPAAALIAGSKKKKSPQSADTSVSFVRRSDGGIDRTTNSLY